MSQPVITPNNSFVLPGDDSKNTPWGAPVQLLQQAFQQLDALIPVLVSDTGTANSYAIALTPAPPATLKAGFGVLFKAAHANTGASTLAINGGSAIAIKKAGTTALSGAEIAANQIVYMIFDGTNFQLITV